MLDSTPPPQSNRSSPPESIHGRAASGDGAACALIAQNHYHRALDGTDPAIIALTRAAEYARLAIANRSEREDWLAMLHILDARAEAYTDAGFDRQADESRAEILAIADLMADCGDEEVSAIIGGLAERFPPSSMEMAKSLSDTVKGKVGW